MRNIPEETRRRLRMGKEAQGVTFAVYLTRLELLQRITERETRKKGPSAVVARALLAEAGLRFDTDSG